MNDAFHSEDQTILAALEALGRGIDASGPIPPAGADETADTLTRLYLETLGLLPYALEPVAPRPAVEEALLAAVRGEETQGVVEQALEPIPEPIPVPAPPPRAPAAPAARPRLIPMPPATARAALRRRRWPAVLAATLIFGLLGLAGWLEIQLQGREGTIADLQGEVAALKEQARSATAEANRARLDILDLKEKFALVTSPAVEVRPMRPDEKVPLQPNARGVLFVRSDHQHWYLYLRNLQPVEGQQAYCLWFINDDGPVMGGAFVARPGVRIELSAKEMPAGTKDVRVTLEDSAHPVGPAGPLVLKATAVYQL